MNKIRFETWFAVDDVAAIRIAEQSHGLPLYVRLMFLALGQANRIGHAPMGVGELRRRLQLVDKASGVLRQPDHDTVSKAIRTGVDRGLLGEGSSAKCLLAPWWRDLGAHRESFCHTCGVDDRAQTHIRRRRTRARSDHGSEPPA